MTHLSYRVTSGSNAGQVGIYYNSSGQITGLHLNSSVIDLFSTAASGNGHPVQIPLIDKNGNDTGNSVSIEYLSPNEVKAIPASGTVSSNVYMTIQRSGFGVEFITYDSTTNKEIYRQNKTILRDSTYNLLMDKETRMSPVIGDSKYCIVINGKGDKHYYANKYCNNPDGGTFIELSLSQIQAIKSRLDDIPIYYDPDWK